jgi:hypothetical protein
MGPRNENVPRSVCLRWVLSTVAHGWAIALWPATPRGEFIFSAGMIEPAKQGVFWVSRASSSSHRQVQLPEQFPAEPLRSVELVLKCRHVTSFPEAIGPAHSSCADHEELNRTTLLPGRNLSRVCKTKAADIGVEGPAIGPGPRGNGRARWFGAGRESKSRTSRRMLPTAIVPAGVHEAVEGSSINWHRAAPCGMWGPWPSA